MKSEHGILFIEPSAKASAKPIVDWFTRKMTAAFRQGIPGVKYRGFHLCSCGAKSSNCDYTLPGGDKTNSLCVHYLAFHRNEVPISQLEKVRHLTFGEAEPTKEELKQAFSYAGLGVFR